MARILGICLLGELVILFIFSFAVLFKGGGPDGIVWSALNPAGIFGGGAGVKGAAAVFGASAAGVGFFGAYWSWVGFEMAPNYAEEAQNPKKMMGYAIYISCLGPRRRLHVLVVDARQRLRLGQEPVAVGSVDSVRDQDRPRERRTSER